MVCLWAVLSAKLSAAEPLQHDRTVRQQAETISDDFHHAAERHQPLKHTGRFEAQEQSKVANEAQGEDDRADTA